MFHHVPPVPRGKWNAWLAGAATVKAGKHQSAQNIISMSCRISNGRFGFTTWTETMFLPAIITQSIMEIFDRSK